MGVGWAHRQSRSAACESGDEGRPANERLYRWIALGVLALAIGRLFLFDVWQLDTIFRIVSFLVLGAVLLALGFLYNRLAGLISKWM